MSLSMKNAEIERQQSQYPQREEAIEPPIVGKRKETVSRHEAKERERDSRGEV